MKKLALIAALALPLAAWDEEPRGTTNTSDKSKTTDRTNDNNSNVPSNKSGTDKTADKSKTSGKEKMATDDLQAMAMIHHVNQMEIEMGKQAQTKGSTQGVKAYGQMLVRDHQSANKDLMALAKKNGATIPMFKLTDEADQKDTKDQKEMAAHIKTLKGADFDKEFLNMMVQGHEKVLAKVDSLSSSMQNTDLQTMLKDLKPALQKHADQARDLQKSQPQAMK
jgi:putative membrane protein